MTNITMLTSLTDAINRLMQSTGMTVAVHVYDFSDQEQLSINGNRVYAGASLIKVPIAVHILELATKGDIKLSDTVELDLSLPEYHQPMGSGVLTHLNSRINISIYDLLTLSLSESDNLATNELLKFTSFERINQTLENYGLSTTRVTTVIHDFKRLALETSNPITADEIGLLYKKLFYRELPLSETLISILSNQKYSSRIPFFLPEFDEDLTIAHKTGSVGTNLHDAGLVMRPEFNYSISLLGSGNRHWLTSSMVLARISEQVYAYMMLKHCGAIHKSISLEVLEPHAWF